MSGDPMRLVRFMCSARGHSTARSEAALTIHEGAWAFCYAGGQTPGHDWQPVDGLPLNDAMRFAKALPDVPPSKNPVAVPIAPGVRKAARSAPRADAETPR
jgi:hypothetical protein